MFELTPFIRNDHFFFTFDPFKEMEVFEKRFFGQQLPAFKTDIRETEQAYVLEAELPGFSKEDIHAEIKDGYLTIHAEHKSENDTKDSNQNYIRRERSYGTFTRSFDLEGIKTDDISASYQDGILSITLPKEEVKRDEGRRLDIQ